MQLAAQAVRDKAAGGGLTALRVAQVVPDRFPCAGDIEDGGGKDLVALGVLADTFLVRTILLPTLVADLGPRFWWPTKVPSTLTAKAKNSS